MESNNMYKNGIPQFDGHKYAFWSRRMKTYIHSHGFEIWKSVAYEYKEPSVPPTNERAIKLGQNNSKEKNPLLNGLCESVYTKVIHCKSSKEIWDKLQNIYEGDSNVKEENLQTYKGQFK
jgi:hypothetical protein